MVQALELFWSYLTVIDNQPDDPRLVKFFLVPDVLRRVDSVSHVIIQRNVLRPCSQAPGQVASGPSP